MGSRVRELRVLLGLGILSAGNAFADPYDAGGFTVLGVNVYDPAHLADVAYRHVEASHGVVSPDAYAEGIELFYHEDGYFLARAWPVSGYDGRLTHMVVDEGSIGALNIHGADEKTQRMVEAYFSHVTAHVPPHIDDFERAVMLSDDLSGITVTTTLDVAPQPGPATRQERARRGQGEGNASQPPIASE